MVALPACVGTERVIVVRGLVLSWNRCWGGHLGDVSFVSGLSMLVEEKRSICAVVSQTAGHGLFGTYDTSSRVAHLLEPARHR